MQNNSFFKNFLFVCIIALFASCDKDFNELGSDIIGEDNYGLDSGEIEVTAFNQKLEVVQSNNLPINALGVYDSPFFGKTKASVVTQVELASVNPTIGNSPTITNVELSLPYFSKLKQPLENGDHTYDLQSVYGPEDGNNGKINLSVYQSSYYLRGDDADLEFQEEQKYYSDASADFDAADGHVNVLLNDDADTEQNTEFFFNKAEVKTYKDENGTQVVDTRSAPGMRLNLKKSVFQDVLFGAQATGNLINNNAFKRYFRGLYFKVDDAAGSEGRMAMLNFKLGKVTVTYTVVTSAAGVTPAVTEERTMVLNLNGNTVNLLENNYSTTYANGINPLNVNQALGDKNLYVKGGAGSMTIVSLFDATDTDNNGVSDDLDELRQNKWLVNDASLSFYIDRPSMDSTPGGVVPVSEEPQRIFLYDLTNNRPLMDYYIDNTTSSDPKFNKYVHDGILERETKGDETTNGKRYKIKLTNHIRNLIEKDSTNIKLGLVVTADIKEVRTVKLKTPVVVSHLGAPDGILTIDRIPVSSVFNPLGTVLYGSNIPIVDPNYDKRLKLKVYYTKPN
jgi:hypothetical protein